MVRIFTLVLALVSYGFLAPNNPALAESEPEEAAVEVSEADRAALLSVLPSDAVIGEDDAPVTIIEYASMSCPHCATFHLDVLPDLKERYISEGNAKLVMRHFPLNEPALRAAMLTRCVPKDKYYTFLKVLFKTQDKWAFDADFKEQLSGIAKVGGMSQEEFDACMDNSELETTLLQERLEAMQALNIQSTPTFFVNGEKLQGSGDVEIFAKAIDPLLEE